MPWGFYVIGEEEEVEAISVEDMRAYELNGVSLGIPLLLMMENAGRSVADYIEYRLGGVRGKRIAVIAGKGGNAGDGFVAARHLAGRGARVQVHLAYPPSEVAHEDAKLNLEALLGMDSVRIVKPMARGWLEVDDSDVVVDALLGTGVRGSLRSPIKEAVEAFNKAPGLRVSIDAPTGVDPDTGAAVDEAARADATVTMHKVKRGLLKARLYTGELVVAYIGLTRDAEYYAGPGDVAARIPRRPRDSHKGVGGRVLVVAGSKYYVGAPLLTALSAARTGVDLVYLASPREIAFTAASKCSTVIPYPLRGETLSREDLEGIASMMERVHAVAIGPGLGREEETLEAAARIIELAVEKRVPLVVDADGLKAVAESDTSLAETVILTPHRGEARLLSGVDAAPLEQARSISRRLGATVLVKAPRDAACSAGGLCRENRSGVAAMSVGGTGDVLTGVIAGIMAKRNSILGDPSPLNSAITGAYLVGRAGELAYGRLGESLTALDIVEVIPGLLRDPLQGQTS